MKGVTRADGTEGGEEKKGVGGERGEERKGVEEKEEEKEKMKGHCRGRAGGHQRLYKWSSRT